ncbi:MAG: HyaD/HybD family hydrogenase maturation endopeptidase [Thermodesulfobacteriota bacterium]
MKILVMGIGNTLLRDEGVGVYAVRELEAMSWPRGVEFVDGGIFSQDLFHIYQDFDRMVVLDCVKAGGAPGDLHRLEEADLARASRKAVGVHDFGMLDSLLFAEVLGGRRPTLVVLGVEPGAIEYGEGLTPPVAEALPELVRAAETELRAILDAGGQSG